MEGGGGVVVSGVGAGVRMKKEVEGQRGSNLRFIKG